MRAVLRGTGARGSLAQQARSGFARELPAMWRKHRIQKRQNAEHVGVFMEDQKLQIECGRCGKTMSEILTEVEARTIRDGIGPVYRHCDRCEKTTGWIEAAAERLDGNGETTHGCGAVNKLG